MSNLSKSEVIAARRAKPRATSVFYDRESGLIVVELANRCTFAFPPQLAQGLEDATDDELACIEILGAGYGLFWVSLNVDLSVSGLLAGVFATRSHIARPSASYKYQAQDEVELVDDSKILILRSELSKY